MPSHSLTEPAARPAQCSLVLVQPTGLPVATALLLGSLLLLPNALKLAGSPTPGRKVAGALLGLGLLPGAGYRRACGNRPRLLRFDREALQLEPLSTQLGLPTETILLSSIVAYTYWLRRPLFFQTQAARGLLWASWAALVVALGLFGLGYQAGLLLLFPVVGYWASYYLGRADADLTE